MAKLVYALNQSLDGYVDHTAFGPSLELFRHFIEFEGSLTGTVYGRRMYEVMRYWDTDQPNWEGHEHEFAAVWRAKPKWVASRSLKSAGPNASLLTEDVEEAVGRLKAELAGEIAVAGPDMAQSLTEAGLVDEYRLYIHPVVVGRGKPFFAGPRPRLRLLASDRITEDVVRLTYAPA